MKFDKPLDFRLFVRRVQDDIKDKSFLVRLKACDDSTIPDEDYVLLQDDVASYVKELRLHSDKKTFFKKLQRKELVVDNIANLYALLTHLSLGYGRRCAVRKTVDNKDFKYLRDEVNKMVTKLLNDGKTDNTLFEVLKK